MTRSIEEFGEILQHEAPLAPLTWLRVGGPAQYLLTPQRIRTAGGAAHLSQSVAACAHSGLRLQSAGT